MVLATEPGESEPDDESKHDGADSRSEQAGSGNETESSDSGTGGGGDPGSDHDEPVEVITGLIEWDYAKSGKSVCLVCGGRIGQDEMRFANRLRPSMAPKHTRIIRLKLSLIHI